jgi:hypothetical protein
LQPGESIVLTATPDSFNAAYTRWEGWFAAGTTDLYLYVDSWNRETGTGAVDEGANEDNNRFHLGGLEVAEGDTPPTLSSSPEIPPRP